MISRHNHYSKLSVLLATLLVINLVLGHADNQVNYNNNHRPNDHLYPQIHIPGYNDQPGQYPPSDQQIPANSYALYPTYPPYPSSAQPGAPSFSSPPTSVNTRGNTFRVTLIRGNVNTDDPLGRPMAYYASVGVGTPPTTLNMQFDTGTAETWIPHYNWFPLANNLHYSKGYKGSQSSTSTKENTNYEIMHKGVKMEAKAYVDNLTFDFRSNEQLPVDHHANATAGSGVHEFELHETMAIDLVQQQRFLAVSDASDSTFRYAPFDGVIGLAPVARSSTGTVPLLVRARETGAISHTVFSMYINPVLDSTFGGEITFGGVNPARYTGPIYFHPVTSWFDWSLRLSSVQLGQVVVSCQQGCAAVFDTGLNDIIWGPYNDVVRMMDDYLNAQWDSSIKLYTIHCSRLAGLPQLVFVIDGSQYVLLPTNYVRLYKDPSTGVEKCYLTIRPRETSNWILGTNFLGAYYTVFDMDQRRIGFATMNI